MDQLTRASLGLGRLIVLCTLVLKVLQLSINHFVVTKIEKVDGSVFLFCFFFCMIDAKLISLFSNAFVKDVPNRSSKGNKKKNK